jgi:hypothetical protein
MYKKKLQTKSNKPYVSPAETRSLHHLKNLKNALEAHQTKAASILFRKQLLEHQNKANYTNELSRIRGELSRTNLPHQTRQELNNRVERLKKLGGEIVDRIK